jgi:spoIIIJ-associated protein
MTDKESSLTATESREFDGKTVEHAIEIACKYFEVKPNDLEITVLTKGSTGIFGLGGRKAKIQAAPKRKPTSVTEKRLKEKDETTEIVTNNLICKMPVSENIAEPVKESADNQDKHVDLAKKITEELLNKTNLAGKVEIKAGKEGPYLDISGEDLSLIIGKEGQNLDALEYIVNRIMRQKVEYNIKIRLEAQGYRGKREKNISLLAHRMAKKAKKMGRPVIIQPLGARDRRLIHLALKDVKGIRTHSVGEGIMRKVIINSTKPKQHSRKNNQQSDGS